MPSVKVGEINMYYEVHGKGEPLAIITGLGANTGVLFKEIPVLSKKYQVIVFDNRGAGRSDAPDMPYTMEMMVEDVTGLLDVIGIKFAHIIGISMGGMIAQHLALNYPARVKSLILASTDCGGIHWVSTGDSSQPISPDAAPEERYKAHVSRFFSQVFIESKPQAVREYMQKLIEFPTSPMGFTRQMKALESHDTYDRLPEITVPVMILHGGEDPENSPENARTLAARIPNAELHILNNMRHAMLYEAPEEVNTLILDFLKRNSMTK